MKKWEIVDEWLNFHQEDTMPRGFSCNGYCEACHFACLSCPNCKGTTEYNPETDLFECLICGVQKPLKVPALTQGAVWAQS